MLPFHSIFISRLDKLAHLKPFYGSLEIICGGKNMRFSGAWQEWDTTAWTAAKSWCYKWQHKTVKDCESNYFSLIKWRSKSLYLRPEALIPPLRGEPSEGIGSTWKMQRLQTVHPSMPESGCSGRAGGILAKQLWLPLLTFSLQWHHTR